MFKKISILYLLLCAAIPLSAQNCLDREKFNNPDTSHGLDIEFCLISPTPLLSNQASSDRSVSQCIRGSNPSMKS
ncbi:MAG: hypothetical protein KBS57_05915 [Alistipes sp.]|nr:hypothetical protein [Candidatus Minthomonas equi]